jgi:glycosyltransferase involved in cell wall biosynthesis
MRLADCLVQPSLTEGTPNSVLEALQLNLPIIATSVGGVPDLLRDGLSGMLVPPREPGKLADAMEAVVNSEELRATLSRGISAIDPKYKPETQRASLVRLYEDVLQSAGRQL